jgi:hypothetical protein
VVASWVGLSLVTAALSVPTPAVAGDRGSLDDANRRWRGARCRSRVLLELKGGVDKDGTAKSRWLFWDSKGGNHRARFHFTNAGALRSRFRKGVIPAGTEFECLEWGEDKGDLYLEVVVAGTPARARLFFSDDWAPRVGIKRVDDFERWVRFQVFELLETPDEALVDVPGVASAPAGGGRPRAPAEDRGPVLTGPARPVPGSPSVRVLAASVEPVRAEPGSEVQMIVVYGVEGVPTGMALAVTESRSILRGEEILTSVEQEVHRSVGVHRSSQPITIPAGIAEGVYELRVVVRSMSSSGQTSAMFEVSNDAP